MNPSLKSLVPLLAFAFALPGVSSASPQSVVRTNAAMRVEWNAANGALSSLALADDPAGMNWIEGKRNWGEIRAYRPGAGRENLWDYFGLPYMKFEGLETEGAAVVSRYSAGDFKARVRRELTADGLKEEFTFTNDGYAPLYFLRGQVGLLATFNDSYGPAATCAVYRCHTHIHAHGTRAYVHALKMAPFETELVLSLDEGELDGYSVQIHDREWSDDRGDFVLHPAPFTLRKGESRRLAWTVRAIPAGSFRPPVKARYETCFPGEEFEIADAEGVHRVKAEKPGELEAFGARLRVSLPYEELVRRRVAFIVAHQQCRDAESPLDGAFLAYDNEDARPYFDGRWGDHNASRERLGMGLLLARWLQTHDDPAAREALDRFEKFAFREFIDEKTGAVYNTIGKDPSFKRLYNAPWAVMFMSELWRLKKDARYLDIAERIIRDYYANGGEKFYPVACAFGEVIAAMRDAGRDVTALKAAHRRHIDNILANGIDYPPHEVKFEQTIVSPAVSLLENYWLYLDRDPKVRAAIDLHLAMLARFDGDQPDHVSGGVPIRHWDDYWFGKLHVYGDTLHYWSAFSGDAYALYAKISSDRAWNERAERCFRNVLYLFGEDGSAACAYLVPYRIVYTDEKGEDRHDRCEGVRGERHDPWANDQDFGLYFILRNRDSGPAVPDGGATSR